jgi:hypothetical protein
VTLDNPVYLRNAMVDLLTRRTVERKEIPLSTSVEVAQVEQAELPVAPVRKFRPVEADIDHLASHYEALTKAKKDIAEMEAYVGHLERKIKEELDKRGATDGRINGAVVLTYRPIENFRFKEFAAEKPEIYNRYLVPRVVDQLDKAALMRDHAGVLEEFRSYSFQVK